MQFFITINLNWHDVTILCVEGFSSYLLLYVGTLFDEKYSVLY